MSSLALGFRAGSARLLLPGLAFALLAAIVLSAWAADLAAEGARVAADRALTTAAFGLALPILAYLTAEAAFGGSRFGKSTRLVARHGGSGRLASLGQATALAGALALGAACIAGAALVSAYPLGDPRLWSDLGATLPIALVAGIAYAGWYAFASSFGAAGGGRKWLLGFDWILGASSGVFALPWPRGHVRNLLGGTPIVEMSQSQALWVLVAGTSLAMVFALVRSTT
jgi:hypothetical protein